VGVAVLLLLDGLLPVEEEAEEEVEVEVDPAAAVEIAAGLAIRAPGL